MKQQYEQQTAPGSAGREIRGMSETVGQAGMRRFCGGRRDFQKLRGLPCSSRREEAEVFHSPQSLPTNGAVKGSCLINTPIDGGAAAPESEEKPFKTVSVSPRSYTPMNGGVNEKRQFIVADAALFRGAMLVVTPAPAILKGTSFPALEPPLAPQFKVRGSRFKVQGSLFKAPLRILIPGVSPPSFASS